MSTNHKINSSIPFPFTEAAGRGWAAVHEAENRIGELLLNAAEIEGRDVTDLIALSGAALLAHYFDVQPEKPDTLVLFSAPYDGEDVHFDEATCRFDLDMDTLNAFTEDELKSQAQDIVQGEYTIFLKRNVLQLDGSHNQPDELGEEQSAGVAP